LNTSDQILKRKGSKVYKITKIMWNLFLISTITSNTNDLRMVK